MRVVIDTNILFAGLSYTSYYFPIVEGIYTHAFDMLVSTPILLEYEEILRQEHTPVMVEYFLEFLRTSDNIVMVNPTFRFQLPFADEDDQKFVDCGVCGNADFLITNDRHFRILQHIAFPRLRVITAESFMQQFLRL